MARTLNSRAANEFVHIELKVALTLCRVAENSDDSRFPNYLQHARKAYNSAVHYMFKVNKSDKEFDQMTAQAERLRFLLESLQAREDARILNLQHPLAR